MDFTENLYFAVSYVNSTVQFTGFLQTLEGIIENFTCWLANTEPPSSFSQWLVFVRVIYL